MIRLARKVHFVNLIARHGETGKKQARFLLCSHYDTKTFDRDHLCRCKRWRIEHRRAH